MAFLSPASKTKWPKVLDSNRNREMMAITEISQCPRVVNINE
jgi:hypothetical protein